MASTGQHKTSGITAGVVLVTAAVVSGDAAAQRELEPGQDEHQRQIVAKIQHEQAANGPYSSGLLDPLRALGLLYQESGDHALAIAALERARFVVRANLGLSSLEQAPLLRQQIVSEVARGNAADAWELEQELQSLAMRHPNDLRTVQLFREIGDRRLRILNDYLAGRRPPEIILGCFYDPISHDDYGSCHAGSKRVVVRSLLMDAWRGYEQAIKVLLRNGLYSSDQLRRIEMDIVRSSYTHDGYRVGRASLRRLLQYEAETAAPTLAQVEALVRIADWDLLFIDNKGAPLKMYAQARELLEQSGVPDETVDRIFSPRVPVVLPAFLPNPLAADENVDSTEYIDVAFELTKYGKSRRVRVIDAAPSVTAEAQERLVRLVSRSRFRPRLIDGEFASSDLLVRYRLTD